MRKLIVCLFALGAIGCTDGDKAQDSQAVDVVEHDGSHDVMLEEDSADEDSLDAADDVTATDDTVDAEDDVEAPEDVTELDAADLP